MLRRMSGIQQGEYKLMCVLACGGGFAHQMKPYNLHNVLGIGKDSAKHRNPLKLRRTQNCANQPLHATQV